MAAQPTSATIPESSKPIWAPSEASAAPPQNPLRCSQEPRKRKYAMLRLNNVHVRYGPVPALRGLDIEIAAGEVAALIGANGAGKSTTLKAISGLVPLADGTIELNGKSLAGVAPEQRVELGIIHVPEGRRIFPRLTVDENLRVGAYASRARSGERQARDRVYGLFPRLAERRR